MSSIFVRLKFGRDAGQVKEMRFDEARELIAKDLAVRVNFEKEDAQALAVAVRPAAPAPVAPPVQAEIPTRRDPKKLRRAIASKLRRLH